MGIEVSYRKPPFTKVPWFGHEHYATHIAMQPKPRNPSHVTQATLPKPCNRSLKPRP